MAKKLLLAVCALMLMLVLSELMLRTIGFPKPRVSGWVSWADPSELNDFGFRGQAIEYGDEDFVVLLTGDSSVEAEACSYYRLPETQLQQHLSNGRKNIKVFSLGAQGYGQDQQLLALKEYFKSHRADLVVLWLTPDNDVWNNLFPTHWPADGYPKPTYWLEKGTLQGPTEAWLETITSMKLFNLAHRLLWSRDKRWERRLPPAYKPMAAYEGQAETDWQSLWDGGGFRNENLATEKSHLAFKLTPRSERMLYGLDLSRALLHEIQLLTRQHGAELVLFDHQVDGAFKNVEETVQVLNGAYYRLSIRQYLDNLEYMTEGYRHHALPVTMANPHFSPTDPHLNEHAVDQVMKDLSETIADLIPTTP